jgi:starch phosphorylase
MNLLESGHFNQFEPGIFDELIASIKSKYDPWMTIADFKSYVDAQKRVESAYLDKEHWTRMSILNCANSGKFSTDRTISDYNRDIWKLAPVPVQYP